jgi:hypothetical protein
VILQSQKRLVIYSATGYMVHTSKLSSRIGLRKLMITTGSNSGERSEEEGDWSRDDSTNSSGNDSYSYKIGIKTVELEFWGLSHPQQWQPPSDRLPPGIPPLTNPAWLRASKELIIMTALKDKVRWV